MPRNAAKDLTAGARSLSHRIHCRPVYVVCDTSVRAHGRVAGRIRIAGYQSKA